MSEKKYFTAVFEWTDAYEKSGNPFTTDIHSWGPAVGLATGNLMYQSEIYENALGEIAHNSGHSECAEIAQKAIDDANAYIRKQIAAGGGK